MKILLCLNKDIFSIISFNMLYQILKNEDLDITILMTENVGKVNISNIAKIEKIIPLEGIFPTLEALENYSSQRKYMTLSQIISDKRFNFNFVKTINSDFCHNIIASNDLVISIRFGSIFKQPSIDRAKSKIINLHSAILPDYRGILGTFRALQKNETKIGSTIHYITDSGIDTGEIIETIDLKPNYTTTLFQNILSLYERSIPALAQLILNAQNLKHIPTYIQDMGKGAYFSNPTLDEITCFEKNIMPIYNQNDISTLIKIFS